MTFFYLPFIKVKDPNDIEKILNCPQNQDESVWQYEHIRQFIIELNHMAVELGKECNSNTCQIMQSGTEKYLCAQHPSNSEVSTFIFLFDSILFFIQFFLHS